MTVKLSGRQVAARDNSCWFTNRIMSESGEEALNRPYYQSLVIALAAFSHLSGALAPGISGTLIPQISSGDDVIFVSKSAASWVGERKILA